VESKQYVDQSPRKEEEAVEGDDQYDFESNEDDSSFYKGTRELKNKLNFSLNDIVSEGSRSFEATRSFLRGFMGRANEKSKHIYTAQQKDRAKRMKKVNFDVQNVEIEIQSSAEKLERENHVQRRTSHKKKSSKVSEAFTFRDPNVFDNFDVNEDLSSESSFEEKRYASISR
jgi:hypothetical protein